jgi:hypothetical protein
MTEPAWTFAAIAFPAMFAIVFLGLLCVGHIQLGCNFKVDGDGDGRYIDMEHGNGCGVIEGGAGGRSGGRDVVVAVKFGNKI